MNTSAKDTPEVAEFMMLFARLKDWVDDEPSNLEEMAFEDAGVRSLCLSLSLAAGQLKRSEKQQRTMFAEPVNPSFIAMWRDYEQRYSDIVSRNSIFLKSARRLASGPARVPPKAERDWDDANVDAQVQAAGIEEAIAFAEVNADQDERWEDEQQHFIKRIQAGVEAWESMKGQTGFDLQGVFRRRALVPFVLVPRGVAAKIGIAEAPSLLRNLQKAHDAFVFGADYAAIALMRSIMEAVLRDHYRAEGKDLAERIRSARPKLPAEANEAALHRLRKLANAVLHLDRDNDEGLPRMEDLRLEKEIVSLLHVLRALIEGAK